MMRLLTADEIQQLFERHVRVNDTREYSDRYSRLPLSENRRTWRWEGKDVARVVAVLEFGRYCTQYHLSARHLLTFNAAGDPELEYLSFEAHSNFNYADDPTRFDLHQLEIPEAAYDFAMVNQTLEHVYNPFVSLRTYGSIWLRVPTFMPMPRPSTLPTLHLSTSTPVSLQRGLRVSFAVPDLRCLKSANGEIKTTSTDSSRRRRGPTSGSYGPARATSTRRSSYGHWQERTSARQSRGVCGAHVRKQAAACPARQSSRDLSGRRRRKRLPLREGDRTVRLREAAGIL